jgi:uncharacterized protein Usg
MGKPSLIDKYLEKLDTVAGIIGSLTNLGKISTYINNNKGKCILIYVGLVTLTIMYSVWDLGHCVSCEILTEQDVEPYTNSSQELINFYQTQVYVPYDNLSTYLKDLIFPLSLGLIQSLVLISLLYLGYKLSIILMKNIQKAIMKRAYSKYNRKANDNENKNR